MRSIVEVDQLKFQVIWSEFTAHGKQGTESMQYMWFSSQILSHKMDQAYRRVPGIFSCPSLSLFNCRLARILLNKELSLELQIYN